jgi:hypothetical protein
MDFLKPGYKHLKISLAACQRTMKCLRSPTIEQSKMHATLVAAGNKAAVGE